MHSVCLLSLPAARPSRELEQIYVAHFFQLHLCQRSCSSAEGTITWSFFLWAMLLNAWVAAVSYLPGAFPQRLQLQAYDKQALMVIEMYYTHKL